MSGLADKIRANEAQLEEAKRKRDEKQLKDSGFTEMDWVQLQKEIRTDQDTGEVHRELEKDKFIRKFRENPMIPVGAVLTTGFLVAGLGNFMANKRRTQQMMMRGRVVAQGFTFAAMIAGVMYSINDKMATKDVVTSQKEASPATIEEKKS